MQNSFQKLRLLGSQAGRRGWLSLAACILVLVLVMTRVDWTFVMSLRPLSIVTWWKPLARAGGLTLAVTACSIVFGLALGIVIAILMWIPCGRIVKFFLGCYIEVGRNVPLIVQLFWIHFALPLVTGISTTAFVSGFIALSWQSSAYLADITRAGIQAIPRGQWLAAEALGMPVRWIWLEIVLPQALKIMLPAIGNLAISFLNASALLSMLGVNELTNVAAKISDYAMQPIEIMTGTAIMYLACNLLLTGLLHLFERRLTRIGNAL